MPDDSSADFKASQRRHADEQKLITGMKRKFGITQQRARALLRDFDRREREASNRPPPRLAEVDGPAPTPASVTDGPSTRKSSSGEFIDTGGNGNVTRSSTGSNTITLNVAIGGDLQPYVFKIE